MCFDGVAIEARGESGTQSYDYEEGIEAQYQINLQHARKLGYVIPDSPEFRFSENHVSGRAADRKGFDRPCQTAAGGRARFECVIVKDRSRFGRFMDLRDHIYWERQFDRWGVPIIFCTESQPLDFKDGLKPEDVGRYVMNVLEGINGSLELGTTQRRITTGMRSRVIQGFYPQSHTPYGCVRWLADLRTGELVRPLADGECVQVRGCGFKLRWSTDARRDAITLIYERILVGDGSRRISSLLEDRGMPRPGRGPWLESAVLGIARDPIYMGTLIWPKGLSPPNFLRPGARNRSIGP